MKSGLVLARGGFLVVRAGGGSCFYQLIRNRPCSARLLVQGSKDFDNPTGKPENPAVEISRHAAVKASIMPRENLHTIA